MSQATVETVERVARLARLSLTAEEKALFASQLDQILAYAQSIQGLALEAATPMSHAATSEIFREDQNTPGMDRSSVLEAAPDAVDGLFRVPKVLG